MRLKTYFLTASCILLGTPVFAQNLDQLQGRVSKFWEFRSQANRVDALKFVDPETQKTFLQQNESPISKFKIAAIEFTEDANRIAVSVTVRSMIPLVGEVDRTVREEWLRKDGEWFMHSAAPKSLFDSTNATQPATPFEFHVSNTTVDVGRHAQGDVVDGKIPFKAPRADTRVIRPLQRINGLAIGAPTWTDASQGYLPYRWETLLLSQSVNQTVTLEAIATNDMRAATNVQFRAQIDGKIGFKQVPEILDPTSKGQVELSLQNLSTKPLKILSVMSNNPAFVVDENVPESIDPGKTGKLVIRYGSQGRASGASVGFVFSENLGGMPITTVPLNVQLPEEAKPAAYTPEDLKRFLPAQQPQLPAGR